MLWKCIATQLHIWIFLKFTSANSSYSPFCPYNFLNEILLQYASFMASLYTVKTCFSTKSNILLSLTAIKMLLTYYRILWGNLRYAWNVPPGKRVYLRRLAHISSLVYISEVTVISDSLHIWEILKDRWGSRRLVRIKTILRKRNSLGMVNILACLIVFFPLFFSWFKLNKYPEESNKKIAKIND